MDVDPQSLLLTTAELSAAFAGFASLVGVFASRRQGAVSDEISDFLRSLLDYGLLAIWGCLLPFVPMLAGAGDAAVWAVSSGVLGLTRVAYILISHRWYRAIMKRGVVLNRRGRWIMTGDALALAAQLLNTGWLWTPSLFVHYASVLWLLTGAALCFRWVVQAAWSGEG
jgi:hypothetical protein